MEKHIASCSFGKDSLATVILAHEHGEPLDEAVYCEVMFDRCISGEVPEHRDFIHSVAIPKLRSWGIKTTVIRPERTYLDNFTRVIGSGPKAGEICAFPLSGRCQIQRDCKRRALHRYFKAAGEDVTQYVGIAADERERLARLGPGKISLLEKYDVTESDTYGICERHGLLSPAYAFARRGGCWFCPNAKLPELRHLYDHHPDLWARLLELQELPNKATEMFNRDMRIEDIDRNFRIDDAQITWKDLGL